MSRFIVTYWSRTMLWVPCRLGAPELALIAMRQFLRWESSHGQCVKKGLIYGGEDQAKISRVGGGPTKNLLTHTASYH